MALAEAFTNSATIGATELSLPRNATYDNAQPQTGDGIYYIMLDLGNVAPGDQFEVKVYEKVTSGGTQRLMETWIIDGSQQSAAWTIFTPPLLHGWDVTLKKAAGTDRAIGWSIRQVA